MVDDPFLNQNALIDNSGIITTNTQQDTGQISITPSIPTPNITEVDASIQASKYAFTTDGTLDQQQAKEDILNGQNQRLKEWIANKRELANENARVSLVQGEALAGNTPQNLQKIMGADLRETPTVAYANEFALKAVSSIPAFLSQASTEKLIKNPDAFDEQSRSFENVIGLKEIAHQVAIDNRTEIENRTLSSSWLNLASKDFLGLFVPGLSWYRFRELANKADAPVSFWKSNNIEEVISKMYSLPKEEAYKEISKLTRQLLDGNVYDAVTFLHGLESYGSSDRLLNNIETISDALVLGSTALKVPSVLRGVTRAITSQSLRPSTIAEATGDLRQAARLQAVERFREQAVVTGNEGSVDRVLNTAQNLFNPNSVLTNIGNYSSEASNRLLQSLNKTSVELLSKVTNTISVPRIAETSPALVRGFTEAENYIRTTYRHLNDAILQVTPVSADAGLANTPVVETLVGKVTAAKIANPKPYGSVSEGFSVSSPLKIEMIIGKTDATAFETIEQATTHANDYYSLIPNSYQIKELGDRYVISIIKQVDESAPSVKAALATELRTPEPNRLWNWIGRRIGVTDDIMGASMNEARKTASQGASDLLKSVADIANEKIGGLRKQNRRDFMQFVETQQRFESGDGRILGRFSNTVGDFESEWRSLFNRAPTEKETDAYFHYTMLSDFDWSLRNLDSYSKLASAGYRSILLETANTKMKDAFLNGKIIDAIPAFKGEFPNVLIWDNQVQNIRRALPREIDNLVSSGYQIIRLTRQSGQDIRQFPGLTLDRNSVDYVLARDFKETPLRWDQVAYRPGGHREYIDDFFVSSANITRGTAPNVNFRYSTYHGDFNLASVRTREQGQIIVDLMNEARLRLREGNNAGLTTLIENRFPSNISEQRFRNLFNTELDINEPFRLRRRSESLADSHPLAQENENFRRASDSLHHAEENVVDTTFTGQRHEMLPNFSTEGTAHNPVIRLGDARLLDPLATLDKSVKNVTRGLYMEDAKIRHATDYIARFGDLLDIPNETEAQLNPFKYLLDGKFKEGAVDLERVAAAKAYRRTAMEFLRTEDKTVLDLRNFRERILNSVFERFGSAGLDYVEPYALHQITDPFRFFRSLAFHQHIGMFNWTSYITQMSQFTTMAAIDGNIGRISQALAWGQYQRMLPMASNEVATGIAERAGRWGSANFNEAYQGWLRSGLNTVGGEMSQLNDFTGQKVIKNSIGTFLDMGKTFFDMGERNSRQVAWNLAYLQWRQREPTAAMTDEVLRQLIDRTDLMTGNMTRASMSHWQSGVMSVPLQFNNWQIRMTEQMLGDRLTSTEKLRLIGLNSILYGIPAGASQLKMVGTSLVPWNSVVNSALFANGASPDDSTVMKLMLDGIVPFMLEAATGDRWNVGEKYGPSSRNFLQDALYNDKNFWSLIGGASGDTIASGFKLMSPLLYTAMGVITGKKDVYPVNFEDLKDEFVKLLPVLTNAQKAYTVINQGKYISKSGTTITDLDSWKGWVIGATGLQPGEAVKIQHKQDYLSVVKGVQDILTNRIRSNYLEALKSTDDEGYNTHMRKVNALFEMGNFNPRERASILRRVMSDNQTLVDNVNKRFIERGPDQLKTFLREVERKR